MTSDITPLEKHSPLNSIPTVDINESQHNGRKVYVATNNKKIQMLNKFGYFVAGGGAVQGTYGMIQSFFVIDEQTPALRVIHIVGISTAIICFLGGTFWTFYSNYKTSNKDTIKGAIRQITELDQIETVSYNLVDNCLSICAKDMAKKVMRVMMNGTKTWGMACKQDNPDSVETVTVYLFNGPFPKGVNGTVVRQEMTEVERRSIAQQLLADNSAGA